MSNDQEHERTHRCIWCGLPQFGDNRCVCDSPDYRPHDRCEECGDWREPDYVYETREGTLICNTCGWP